MPRCCEKVKACQGVEPPADRTGSVGVGYRYQPGKRITFGRGQACVEAYNLAQSRLSLMSSSVIWALRRLDIATSSVSRPCSSANSLISIASS